jgi:hypothetical protein
MSSTDRKLELTAKASMAQPVSQPAVCSNGLTREPCWLTSTYKTGVIIFETVLSESGNLSTRPEFGNELHSVAIVKVVQCLFCCLPVMRPFCEGYWTRGHVQNKHGTRA